ncbi:hypothetical protein ES703_43239 [subsurface metagenome]
MRKFIALMLLVLHSSIFAEVILNDGGYHLINGPINDTYKVDFQTPNMFTHLEVTTNGTLNHAYMYENSLLTVSGGNPGYVYGYEQSNIYINSGRFYRLNVEDDSHVVISGCDYGNSISQYGNSYVTIFGSDFVVGGLTLSQGVYSSLDFPSEFNLNCVIDNVNNSFHVILRDNSRLYLIPEPASLLLIGFGGIFLIKYVRKSC